MRLQESVMVLALLAGLCPPARALSQAYPPEVLACAGKESQLFFHYLAPGPGAGVKEYELVCAGKKTAVRMPDWMEKSVADMAKHKVWKDPEEGELSEAQLWQAPASILYEFTELAQQALPAAEKPLDAPPFTQEKDYRDILLRFSMSLDRIRRSRLQGSLEGRGAGLLASFSRVLEQFDALADAVPAGDEAAYRRAVSAAAEDARDCFAQLFAAPRTGEAAAYRYNPKPRVLPGYRGASLLLPWHQVAFLHTGQRVDVLVTFEAKLKGDVKEKVTATILQNVIVVDVQKTSKLEGKGVVQLLLNPNEAQYAALGAQQGELHIAARSEGDVEMHPMEMASFRKLFR